MFADIRRAAASRFGNRNGMILLKAECEEEAELELEKDGHAL
jgi:hypothetical protein